jgi:DNA-binding response OmpR family regulator
LAIGEAEIDFDRQALLRQGKTLELSSKELGILRLLTAKLGKPVSRETFLDVVWGYHAYPSTRTVDNFISGLRAKLEEDPANPHHLITVRGEGYRLDGASPIEPES